MGKMEKLVSLITGGTGLLLRLLKQPGNLLGLMHPKYHLKRLAGWTQELNCFTIHCLSFSLSKMLPWILPLCHQWQCGDHGGVGLFRVISSSSRIVWQEVKYQWRKWNTSSVSKAASMIQLFHARKCSEPSAQNAQHERQWLGLYHLGGL